MKWYAQKQSFKSVIHDSNSPKVALLGNMNNNHFALARFLRDKGIDASLLLYDDQDEHFHPKCDTFGTDYMSWTRQLSWGSIRRFLSTSPSCIKEDLKPYDIIIGNGPAPAFCEKACRRLDVFVPYGADLWDLTAFNRLMAPHIIPHYWAMVYYQRKAIPRVEVFHMHENSNMFEERANHFQGNAVRWTEGLPMVYSPEYQESNVSEMTARTHWGHEFKRIREETDLMVVAHGRHHWGNHNDPNTKGNDRLILGWKMFCERYEHLKCKLVLIEYGNHIQKSKKYIEDLKLENQVVWLPKMYRKDIVPGLLMADIVAGEFEHSWAIGGVYYEALVAGKPLLAYRDENSHGNHKGLYQIYNAKDPEAIAQRLGEHIRNKNLGLKIGQQGKQWYEEQVVKKTIDKYCDYIQSRLAGGL